MLYSISKNYIKDIIDLIDTANEKITKYPSDSEITHKFSGEYYSSVLHKEKGTLMPLHMWKLDVTYDSLVTKHFLIKPSL